MAPLIRDSNATEDPNVRADAEAHAATDSQTLSASPTRRAQGKMTALAQAPLASAPSRLGVGEPRLLNEGHVKAPAGCSVPLQHRASPLPRVPVEGGDVEGGRATAQRHR
eukprot:9025299-Pyramimonas_sp.AAC.1